MNARTHFTNRRGELHELLNRRGLRSRVSVLVSIVLASLAGWAVQAQVTNAPALALRSELTWTPVYVGDPLRVRVFLSSPLVFEESLDLVRRIEQGEVPAGDPPAPSVQLPTEWQTQVSLRLSRLKPDGGRELVFAAPAWTPYLRPQVGLPAGAGRVGSVRSREWLVQAEMVQMTVGVYVIETSWEGSGLVPAEQLPSSGVLTAEELRFEVVSPDTVFAGPGDPDPQANHVGRLAFAAYVSGNHSEARRLGTEALERDPGNLQPDRLETHLLVARSALAVRDYTGAKAALDQFAAQPGAEGLGEVLELVRTRLESLAPQLRLFLARPPGDSLRLEIRTLPGLRYVTYESADLHAWLPLSTNLSLTNWIMLPASPVTQDSPRFYRSVLHP